MKFVFAPKNINIKNYTEKLCWRFAFLPVIRTRNTGETEIIWLESYYSLYRYYQNSIFGAAWVYIGSFTKNNIPEKFKNSRVWEP